MVTRLDLLAVVLFLPVSLWFQVKAEQIDAPVEGDQIPNDHHQEEEGNAQIQMVCIAVYSQMKCNSRVLSTLHLCCIMTGFIFLNSGAASQLLISELVDYDYKHRGNA